jgi:hypothetical protein
VNNITHHPRGLLVQVERRGHVHRAWFPCPDAARLSTLNPLPSTYTQALALAVAARDQFIAAHGTVADTYPRANNVPRHRAYSNTGLTGVSETVRWQNNRPKYSFAVSWPGGRAVRITYGPQSRTRAQALAAAAALRTRMITPLSTEH